MIDFKLFYGLEFNPFEKGQEDITVQSFDFKEATGRLNFLKETRGIGLFTGRSGVGKTYVLKKFCESLNPGLYQVVYLPVSTLTTNEFYRALCQGLGLEPKFKKIDNYRNIQEYIQRTVTEKRIVPVIVLDEAQYLKTDILNDLKLILNFDFDSKNYAILILAGIPTLINTLNKTVHEALKQRVVIQYQILGLDGEDVPMYIQTKLKKAGRSDPLFRPEAYTALSNACQGSARRLNNLVTQALIIGANQSKQIIDTDIIMQAANEIG